MNCLIAGSGVENCPIRLRPASRYFRHQGGISCLCQLDAGRYADTVIGTPFTPVTRKAEVREVVINAWVAGFKTALSKVKREMI